MEPPIVSNPELVPPDKPLFFLRKHFLSQSSEEDGPPQPPPHPLRKSKPQKAKKVIASTSKESIIIPTSPSPPVEDQTSTLSPRGKSSPEVDEYLTLAEGSVIEAEDTQEVIRETQFPLPEVEAPKPTNTSLEQPLIPETAKEEQDRYIYVETHEFEVKTSSDEGSAYGY